MPILQDFRRSIDLIDDSIINLLAERMRVVEKVGRFKKKKGIPPLDEERWKQVLDSKISKAKKLGLDPELVRGIYEMIHAFALELEEKT